jgi:hypothetical protein
VPLYTAGSVPGLTAPALVYDPTAHVLYLDTPTNAPVALITLGGTSHPATLSTAEIVIKTYP